MKARLRPTTGGRTATKLAAAFGVTEEVLSARAPDAAAVIGSVLDALAQRPRLWLHAYAAGLAAETRLFTASHQAIRGAMQAVCGRRGAMATDRRDRPRAAVG